MVIGLTGGIGSGKSTVLQMFKELGAVIYIADVEAKKLMNTDEELQLEIIKLLGDQAYSSKKLNKEYVASKVFNDTKLLQKLNALVHPKVQEHFKNFLNKYFDLVDIIALKKKSNCKNTKYSHYVILFG